MAIAAAIKFVKSVLVSSFGQISISKIRSELNFSEYLPGVVKNFSRVSSCPFGKISIGKISIVKLVAS